MSELSPTLTTIDRVGFYIRMAAGAGILGIAAFRLIVRALS